MTVTSDLGSKPQTPPRRPRMALRMVIMLLGVGLLLFLVFGFGAFRNYEIHKFLAGMVNPPQTVTTIEAQTTPWQASTNSTGSVVAINGANLSAEISGIVDTINFQSGAAVQKGDTLLTLRPNNDPAVLAQLQAAAALALVNYNRDAQQLKADAIAKSQLDTDKANLASANAQVAAQQALMAEKQIKAPFAGQLGIRQVDIGQFLTAGTQIVTLQQLNPLFFDFYLPQQSLTQTSVGQTVNVAVDAFPGRTFTGKITALNSAVDTSTRMVQIRATIQNDDMLLRPGMFGTVNIAVGAPQDLVTLPQTSISYNPYGDTVFIAEKGKDKNGKDTLTAKQGFVTLGDTRGDQVAILKGVNAGDQVVTSGQLKLKNGSTLIVNNSVTPTDNPNPNPPNQ